MATNIAHDLQCPSCGSDAATTFVSAPDRGFVYTCFFSHGGDGSVSWVANPHIRGGSLATGWVTEGVTADLVDPLLAIMNALPRAWLEHGVVEYQLRLDYPELFARHVTERGHVLTGAVQATASSVRFATGLIRLERLGHVQHRLGPATGAWSYNSEVAYWALTGTAPAAAELTWEQRCHELGRSSAWTDRDRDEVAALVAAASPSAS